MHVMIVGVAHRPATRVSLCLLRIRAIHQPTVAIGPLRERVIFADARDRAVVDVPFGGGAVGRHPARHARGCWRMPIENTQYNINSIVTSTYYTRNN